MSLHPSNSAPAISGLGISFLPSPTPPSPPQHSSHSHYGHREQPQGQRYDEFEPKQQSHAQRHPQEGAYPAGLGRAGHVQGGRARAASVQMARIVSQDSTGLSDKRIRIASGEPGAYGGLAYEHKDNEGHRHELSPLSDFDTGSSSDEHSFSPASMSSLPSSTNSGAAYYPQYHAAQAPRHLRHAQSMGSLPQIADMLARIPLPQPPRPSTLSVQHTDDELDLPLLSPNSRLPAFLRDRTLQRHSLARPKSMMELGAVYAHVPIAEEPQSGYDGLAEDEVTEQQHDYGTYGGIYSPDSIASSAGGHARRQAEARLQETTAPTRLEVRGHTRSTSDYTYHGSPSDLPYAHPAPELPPTTILRPIARRPVDSPQRPVERVQERRAEAPPALPTERSTPLRHAVVTRPVVERAVEGAASSNLSRHATLLTVGAHPARRGQELDRLLAPSSAKRLSTGASLGSPTPSTGMPALARHVRSVSMASQQPSLHTIMSPVILEQTKSTSKARVELDLVLQSSLIVEGGKMKGKVELRVRKAKDEEQDVWIGRPKIRIVGFEGTSDRLGCARTDALHRAVCRRGPAHLLPSRQLHLDRRAAPVLRADGGPRGLLQGQAWPAHGTVRHAAADREGCQGRMEGEAGRRALHRDCVSCSRHSSYSDTCTAPSSSSRRTGRTAPSLTSIATSKSSRTSILRSCSRLLSSRCPPRCPRASSWAGAAR